MKTNGIVLGRHNGITNYTIGQRRGLALNVNFLLFVADIRLDDNEIVLAKSNDLYRSKLYLNRIYMADNECCKGISHCTVKVRYRLHETPCELNILEQGWAEVRLLKPEAMIATGQTAVFYDGDRLLGGGCIKSSE